MHHCIHLLYKELQAEECYTYKVVYPERSTLQIVEGVFGYTIKQLKTYCNNNVKKNTKRYIHEWLRSTSDNL